MRLRSRTDIANTLNCVITGAISFSMGSILLAAPGLAQLIPDSTLGTESSIVLPDVAIQGIPADFIEGGASRGGNLFHSFTQFNIDSGQRVYFANPIGIENILTRVTGNSVSNINGLLGVNGGANLFLLNPNGVIFGPDARLAISGSFTTSTAGSFTFADGSEFSATPTGNELLTLSVPLGVQFNSPAQGDISSSGTLKTEQNLTLLGNELYLEGQLHAGEDLTLQAQDTVTIRDTETDAFMARAGSDLTIQGNQSIDILTLQHLAQTPFVSGGDLTFISDGVISADAHFASGGNLRFLNQTGDFGTIVSYYDPIISANGNVVFGDYTGVALKVEATGSIQAGNIRITGPDNALTADGSGSDEDLLASSPAAILRAGQIGVLDTLPVTAGDPIGVPPTPTTFETGIINGQPMGSIVITSINTSSNSGAGGPIILDAAGNIIVSQSTDTESGSNSGSLTITADGDVVLGFSDPNNSNNSVFFAHQGRTTGTGDTTGGDVTIQGASVTITGDIDPAALGTGDTTGDTTITATSGDIILNSGTIFGDTGQDDGSTPSRGGDIQLTAAGDIELNGYTLNSTYDGVSIFGGNITLTAEQSIQLGQNSLGQSSSIRTNSSEGGLPGNITLAAVNGDITINGDASSETISANSEGFDTGGFSVITIEAQNGSVFLNSAIVSTTTNDSEGDATSPGFAGDILIDAEAKIIVRNSSRVASDGNFGRIFIGTTNGDFPEADVSQPVKVEISDSRISTTNAVIDGNSNSGSIFIRAQDTITTSSSAFVASTTGVGDGGSITVQNADAMLFDNTTFEAETTGTGNGGSITLQNAHTLILNNTTLEAETTGTGQGGSIFVRGVNAFALRNGSLLLSEAEGGANGGNIIINTNFLVAAPAEDNDIIANSQGGNGGDITINAVNILGFVQQAIFQDTEDLRNNRINDISAKSDFGFDGEIVINTLDIDPSSGLTELPTDLTDRTSQIVAGCGLGNTSGQGEFIITGSGGLPASSSDSTTADNIRVPWVVDDADRAEPSIMSSRSEEEVRLVEAQGLIFDTEGNAYFVVDTEVVHSPVANSAIGNCFSNY